MTKTLFALLISLCLSVVASGQVLSMDEQKLDAFAHAIARAEGFGTKNTIPTRCHNPGDIRSSRNGHHYAGQVGLNKRGYVIFKNDAAGFAALKDQLQLIVSGQSKHYNADMSIAYVAKVYSGGSRAWSKIVSKHLDVPASTTLRSYFDIPPDIRFEDNGKVLRDLLAHDAPVPTLVVSPFDKIYDQLVLRGMYTSDQDNPQRQTNCI